MSPVGAWLTGRFDVAIIGAGIMGASAAYHLVREGLRVVVLEGGRAGSEASAANAGTLSVQNKPLGALPAVLESMRLWQDLHQRLGTDVGFKRTGGIRVCLKWEDEVKLRKDQANQSALGVPSEIVSGSVITRDYPYLTSDVASLSWCQLDGMADPFLATDAFLTQAKRLGAVVFERTPVTMISGGDGRPFEVTTPMGRIGVPVLIGAAGAWNADLLGHWGVTLPLRTLVQQVLVTTPMSPIMPHTVTHVEGRLTLKQQSSTGRFLVGGGWPGKGDRQEGRSRVLYSSLIGNLKLACTVIPDLFRAHLLRAWTGYEGRTSDRLMLAGPVGPEGFFVLGCQSGGFTMSPLAGEIITDHVLGRTSRVEVARFLPERFFPNGAKPGGDALNGKLRSHP